MGLTCPSCGNEQSFQIKTLQMHVVHVDDGQMGVAQEDRPAVLEILCDECEAELELQHVEADVRGEVLHLLGASR
jgi:hypothetical protein